MGMIELTEIELVIGIFDSLFIIISIITGLKLILKYFSHKQISLITVGFAWIFFSISWMGGILTFFYYIIFNITFDRTIYLIIANAIIPLSLLCWIFSFCKLLYPNLIKIIFPIYLVICVIYEIFLLILIFTSPISIGTFYGLCYFRINLFPLPFCSFALTTILITGLIIAKESFKSSDLKIRWRGIFLLLAFISLTISVVLEELLQITALNLTLIRLIRISSAFEYYLGFFLSEKIVKILIKENNI